MSIYFRVFIFVVLIILVNGAFRRKVEKSKCPKVKSSKSFDFTQMLGNWYVIEYYANSEESEIYRCMRTTFYLSPNDVEISMNFTFSFIDDPDNEQLYGNITWRIPDMKQPSHWTHSEDPYEGVYNTYVLDLDINNDKSWMLLLHCAEKSGSPRYLSSFIMSRRSILPVNVISFLRDKLPYYDIDLQYVFKMEQTDCVAVQTPLFFQAIRQVKGSTRHPLKHPEH